MPWTITIFSISLILSIYVQKYKESKILNFNNIQYTSKHVDVLFIHFLNALDNYYF